MRAFGGDLGILGLGNLLQAISLSQARGFLTVSNADLKKTVQFGSQGIRLVSGVRRAIPLGQILVRTGRITGEQLEQLLAEQRSTSRRLGDLVIERGLVTQESVDQALRDQVAEEIYELFAWPEARFYFAEAENESLPSGAGPLASVTLDPNMLSFMVEAARRSDEMAMIRSEIPVDHLVPRRTEQELPTDGLSNEAKEILAFVDGGRTVEQILHESSYPKFTVFHTLYDLKQRGVLAMESPAVAPAPAAAATGPSILFIGKPAEDRAAIGAQLKSGGYSVIDADSWAGAESWLEAVKAIVVDFNEESISICERIREDSRKPFIVLTGDAAGPGYFDALQSGARYVLLKPVPEQLLLERLRSLL